MTKAINSSATVVKNIIHGDMTMRKVLLVRLLAMSVPTVVLFGLAPEMLSNARVAGHGIGIIEAHCD